MKHYFISVLLFIAVNIPAFAANNGVESTAETTEQPKDTDNKVHFSGHFSLSGTVGKAKAQDHVGGGLGGDVTLGVASAWNYLGPGIGLQWYFYHFSSSMETRSMFMPIYVCDKIFLSTGSTAPYIDVSIGGYINLYSKTIQGSKKNMENGKGGGFYLRSGLGLKINNDVLIGIGYQLMYADKSAMHSFYLKFGM